MGDGQAAAMIFLQRASESIFQQIVDWL